MLIVTLHTLNAYSNDYEMCVGQVFIDEKTNEIPATRDLLKIIDNKENSFKYFKNSSNFLQS